MCYAGFLLAVAGCKVILWLILSVVSSFDPRWWVLIQKTISENPRSVRKTQQCSLIGWLFSLLLSSLFVILSMTFHLFCHWSTQLSLRWFRLWERSVFFYEENHHPHWIGTAENRRRSFLLTDDCGQVPTTALWWLLAQQCGAWWPVPCGQGADHVEVFFFSDPKTGDRENDT